MGWGQAATAKLVSYGDEDAPEVLEPGEAAIIDDVGAIYGSPEDLLRLADRIVAKWSGSA
jgi:hypothetical protein